ncbi:MAG: hypothetical protein EOM40_18505 [Clostridia bacterium]|nr:hypothetical protein [Clostridia bacterium]
MRWVTMKNALELIKEFCVYDFQERDSEKTLALLADNISWFGTSDEEDVNGIEEAREYIRQEIRQMPQPYKIRFMDENVAVTSETSSTAKLRVVMSNVGIELNVRVSACAGEIDGQSKLIGIHMSVSDIAQKEGEFYPITVAQETINDLRKKLEESISQRNKLQDSIMKNLPCGIAICDVYPDFSVKLRYISDRFYKMFESTKEEVFSRMEKDLFDCVDPSDKERLYRELMNIAIGGNA